MSTAPRQESSDVGGVVSIFARQMLNGEPITIFGDGTQQRSFTYVKDVVKANLLAAVSDQTKGQVYNCASGIKVTVQELADMMAEMLEIKDRKINYGDWLVGDIKVFDIDNSKIRGHLGLEFVQDFRAGLKLTVDWAIKYFKEARRVVQES